MIIKSIQLENFQCYSGSDNFFEFTEGVNVIIGDNATGKSKLYDAFNWALFDECFETETRKFKGTSEMKGKLISDKAKYETPVGENVKTEVILTFARTTQRNDEEEFIVKRSYQILKKSETTWQEPLKSQLEILKSSIPLKPRPIDEDCKSFIGRVLLPDNIRPYTWFQGEQVDNLIDFENKKALSEAINVLSDISLYDTFVSFAEKMSDSAEKEYQAEARRLGKDAEKFDDLQKQKNDTEKRIEKLKEESEEAAKNWYHAQGKVEQLIGQLETAGEINVLKQQTTKLEQDIAHKEHKLEEQLRQINKFLFTKQWVLRNVGHLVSVYEEKFEAYEKAKMEKEAERKMASVFENKLSEVIKERLPKGNPEPIYLKRMLNEEHCLICDREAKKDSDAWLKIKELLDKAMPQTAKKEDKPLVKHNFNAVFKNLYQQGLRFQDNIAEVDDSVLREMNMIQNLRTDIRELKIELQQAEEKINQLVNVSNISVESSGSITKDFETFNKKQGDYGILKSKKDEMLRNAEKHLIQLEGLIKDVTRGKIPKVLEDKKTILADFKIVAKSTRDRVFHQLIEQLEEEANKHFIAMTKGNQGVKGRIKLVKRDGFYIPRNVVLLWHFGSSNK